MIQVKRNTAEYKEIKKNISENLKKSSRVRSILVYALKPYHSLNEIILLNKQKTNAAIMYDLAYHTLSGYFNNSSKKLFRDQDKNIYFFKSSATSKWIEVPFAFVGKLKLQVKKIIPIELKKVR